MALKSENHQAQSVLHAFTWRGERKLKEQEEQSFDCCFIDQENIERAKFNILGKRKHRRNFYYIIIVIMEITEIILFAWQVACWVGALA